MDMRRREGVSKERQESKGEKESGEDQEPTKRNGVMGNDAKRSENARSIGDSSVWDDPGRTGAAVRIRGALYHKGGARLPMNARCHGRVRGTERCAEPCFCAPAAARFG